jgi:N-acetylglucosaminyldiphosphoundecaprenol N-acetyl-beta-D-mannosaminyltransferase
VPRSGDGVVTVGGVALDRLTADSARRRIADAVTAGTRPPLHVATVNVDFLAIADRDPELRAVLNRCGLTLVDGMPVVWLTRVLRRPVPERVTGADLTAWLIDGGLGGIRLFLLGATDEVLRSTTARAEAHGVTIAGTSSPSRRAVTGANGQEADGPTALVDEINRSRADILLVALGAPLQELFIARHLESLDVGVAIGVGGSLDFLAGRQARAPEAFRRLGLEWLYRLIREPRRLWRRYLARDAPYLLRQSIGIAAERLRGRRAPAERR